MKSFISFLGKTNGTLYKALSGKSAGSSSFDAAWKNLAKQHPRDFQQAQHDFIKASHYSPAASKISSNTGLNVNSRSVALQSAVWSMSTQHGAAGASNIFRNAGIRPNMSDREVLQRVYAERMKVDKYFSRSSQAVKNGVYNRFKRELADALAMLGSGGSTRGGNQSV
jgi:hypothetical protein